MRVVSFTGIVNSADASKGIAVPLADIDGAALAIGARDRVVLHGGHVYFAASGTGRVVFVNPAGRAVLARDEVADTITVAGDHVAFYQAHTHLLLVGATGDNGRLTIADVTLVGDDTVIAVAENLTDGTDDGTVYAYKDSVDQVFRAGSSSVTGFAAALTQSLTGRVGYLPYWFAPAGETTLVVTGALWRDQYAGVR